MKRRVVVPELMDDPTIATPLHTQALAGLARLNRYSRGDAGLWVYLRQEAQALAPRALRVLDLATGSGDLPARLAQRAKHARLNIKISGCDISPTAITLAKQHSTAVEYFQHDVLRHGLPQGYDVIMASLFLHHLSEPEAIQLLKTMATAAGRLVLVNDLNRSWWNLKMVTMACHLLSRSPVVHFDGPASVRAAFTVAEARQLAEHAGLKDIQIQTQFPGRWLLGWKKPT